MKKQIDKNTRIKLKFHLPALATAICLQRKKWFYWKTNSWIYPSVVEYKSCEYIIDWLKWKEENGKISEKSIGKILMDKCK